MPRDEAIEQMLEEVRDVIGKYAHLSEIEVYRALMDEASGWKMRLEELEGVEEE